MKFKKAKRKPKKAKNGFLGSVSDFGLSIFDVYLLKMVVWLVLLPFRIATWIFRDL